MPYLGIHDSRKKWIKPCLEALNKRGWTGGEIKPDEYGLIFPHAQPEVLKRDQAFAKNCKARLVTDLNQILLYENKREQIKQYQKWMPDTWVFTDKEKAIEFCEGYKGTLVSKADVGASSYNVRILKDPINHICQVFDKGIKVLHCDSLGTESIQNDYVILQEFIPHEITYRVNKIGNQKAVFHRYCYPDRQVAQTGNVKPGEHDESLFSIADEIDSKWVALDFLKSDNGWKLLETSLRWPWPSPGECNNALFTSGKKWIDLWDVLIDELEAGSFA